MTDDTMALLQQVMQMSKQMLELAKAGDWDALADIEARRQPLIMQAIPEASSIDVNSQEGLLVLDILQIDVEVTQLIQDERNATRDDLADMNRAKGQVKAYKGE